MAIEKIKSAGQDEVQTEVQTDVQALSSQAVARRHMLLKGLGKGAAVLAATVPIQTLAGQNLLTPDRLHQCSVSGMHSGVHSATPAGTPVCGGFSPGYWGQIQNGQPKRTWPLLPNGWTYDTKCSAVFTKRVLSGDPTLFQVMNPPAYANTDERHWICAWLNALSQSFSFPYTGQQVLDFYYSTTPGVSADALSFFKTYMENN